LVADLLPEKAGYLDADVVGRTRPLRRTMERTDLIQDNIRSCADNFARWGAHHFAVGLVCLSQDHLERLVGILRETGHDVCVVGLVAEDGALISRHKQKQEEYGRDPESLRDAVACNADVRGLQGIHIVDTTGLNPEEMARRIVAACECIEQSPGTYSNKAANGLTGNAQE